MENVLATFTRTLSTSDSKHHIPFPFQVAAGTTRLTIRLTFSPAGVDDIRNMLTLSLFDPAGWRGAGHRHGTQHDVVIGLHEASPGYVAGRLPPGEWQVVVDTHMIMPGAPCALRLEIGASDEPSGEAQTAMPDSSTASRGQGWYSGASYQLALRSTAPRGRGWYRGDLHAHSLHSDAGWDIPDLLAWARERKLDFATLSDHNTVSGLARMDAASAGDLLTMGGMEFTTFWGHALALGVRQWIDWRVTTEGAATGGAASRTIEQMPAEVAALGGLFVIAHPMAVGDPYCTGCQWRYPTMAPGTARAVEVWNSDWRSESRNELGLSLAYQWLNAGHRLALTAGTDNHGRNPKTMHYGFNVVYAEDLTEREILRAVRAGHLYISAGPTLELSASVGPRPPAAGTTARKSGELPPVGERRAMMGDVLDGCPGQQVHITAHWDDCPAGAEVCLIAGGKPAVTLPAGRGDTRNWELQGGEARWCLLTLHGGDGQMLALTNPIFLDGRL